MKHITKAYWIALRELVAMIQDGSLLAMSMLLVGVSGVYLFILSDFFLQNHGHLLIFFEWVPVLSLWLIPTMSMGLIIDEKQSGHLAIYLALPISYFSLLFGKWLGTYISILILLFSTLVFAFTISQMSDLDWGPIYTAYLGLILNTAFFLSIGLWASCYCKHQLSAWLCAFLVCLFYYLIGKIASFIPAPMNMWIYQFSVPHRLSRLNRGIIDSRDIVYFIMMSLLYISLALRQFRAQINKS